MEQDYMGSKKKAESKARVSLARRLRTVEFDSVWELVFAAGASPAERSRWVAVGSLASAALASETEGKRRASSEELNTLLRACENEDSRIGQLQDFLPTDPREHVVVRLGESLVRLFPGSVERPVADIDRALMVASACDDLIRDKFGFGIVDYLTGALRYTDWALTTIAPTWPERGVVENDVKSLSQSELDAARRVLGQGTPAHLIDEEGVRRALDWATADRYSLPYDPTSPQSQFDRFLRVMVTEGLTHWMPLAFLPEAITCGVSALAAGVVSSSEANRRFAQVAAAHVRQHLWKFSTRILGPEDSADGPRVVPNNVVQWIVMSGDDTAIAVQIASFLEVNSVPDDLPWAARAATKSPADASTAGPGNSIPLPGGRITLNGSIEVVPLLVVATPSHIAAPRMTGMMAMSLDDLKWISLTSESSTDLFEFCRDMARAETPDYFGWEIINVWEWWRSNGKSLFSGGLAPTFMFIEPHMGSAEWDRARALRPVEEALHVLDLPPVRDFDGVDHPDSGPPTIYRFGPPLPTEVVRQVGGDAATDPTNNLMSSEWGGIHQMPHLDGWTIHIGHVPVAFAAGSPDWIEAESEFIHRLGGAFAYALRNLDAMWCAEHQPFSISGYVVEFENTSTDSDNILSLIAVTDAPDRADVKRVRLGVEPLQNRVEGSVTTQSMQSEMAAVVRELLILSGLSAASADRIFTAWSAAPPTLTVNMMTVPTVKNRLPRPVELDEAFVSQIDRDVAEAVRQSGVQPGDFRGDSAKSLDRDTLAPLTFNLLGLQLAKYNADDLIRYGMTQLERVLCQRDRLLRDVSESANHLEVEWDPAQRYAELQGEHLMLRRCIEAIVEVTMRSAPAGNNRIDQRAWALLLAAARSYLAATDRSERLHYQVTPTMITISTMFEIAAVNDPEAQQHGIDLEKFAFAKSTQSINRNEQSTSTTTGSSDIADTSDGEVVNPEIDAAMLDSYGVSALDIFTILFAISYWPLGEDEAETVETTKIEVVQYILENTVIGEDESGRRRAGNGVDLLTTYWSEIQQEDWKPWQTKSRKKRILVQSIPELSDGRIIVAPHFCLASLTVYRNYLSQGQLPWSQPEPPKKVKDALASFRDAKNIALEDAVARALRDAGWSVIERVKENRQHRLGIPELSTEIDIVAGRNESDIIYLLEVKDPADIYSPAEMARQLRTFFDDTGRKPSYAGQLKRKFADLAPYPSEISKKLGITPKARTVKAMFVTRNPVCAAFASSEFSFETISSLISAITINSPKVSN
ncbi:hypothetical protein XU06_28315 [Rhodococcus erythropolis]|uniref:hypothetical protein n=1 Tax=Rhodococcus erythropolis TaxID=1833 RepID=UPI00061B73D6|nr:hypothetical protein [Rhodococcus erythropolis]AKE00131.1 hypothetical protein XU06_28315 [Rhodococcus erythropolis]